MKKNNYSMWKREQMERHQYITDRIRDMMNAGLTCGQMAAALHMPESVVQVIQMNVDE